ncbi:UNVERIFIED_ORG: hypothetical protein E4P37_13210, partial [Bacillus sp. AZ43]
MHHAPSGSPLVARRSGAHRTRVERTPGTRRLALGLALSAGLTALLLAVPVVGGGSSSSGAPGQDGQVLPSRAFAGLTTAATFSSATGEASAAPGTRTTRDRETVERPGPRSLPGTTAPAPAPAPAPVTEPAPA